MCNMEKSLYKLCIKYLKRVYAGEYKSYKSTQWNSFITLYKKKRIQILAIAGTNGLVDWFWNLCMLQKEGVKLGAYVSAERVLRDFKREYNTDLYIICHSKSGPVGIRIQELLNEGICIALCPARGFIEEKENKNVIMIIDKDDVVPIIGWSRFCHRICKTIFLPKDKKWWNLRGKIKDHSVDNIEEFVNKMEGDNEIF